MDNIKFLGIDLAVKAGRTVVEAGASEVKQYICVLLDFFEWCSGYITEKGIVDKLH